MWPITSLPKWQRRRKPKNDDEADRADPVLRDTRQDVEWHGEAAAPAQAPASGGRKKKWARGDLRDALTEAVRLPPAASSVPLKDPGRPTVTRAEILAEQRRKALLRDDEEAMALILAVL